MPRGIRYALIAAFISGTSIFLNKFAVGAISPPLVFTSLKNSLVAIFIISLLLASGKKHQLASLSRKEILYLIAIGLVGGSLPFYLFFTGLSSVSAVTGTLINKTMILWVSAMSLPLLGEKLSRSTLVSVFLLFLANLFIGGFTGFSFSWAEGLILLATVLWSVETIIAKKALASLDPDLLVAARMGLGSFILIAFSAVYYPASLLSVSGLASGQWFWLILTALSLFAYVSVWFRALKHASAVSVTAVMVASTVVTNLLTAVFLSRTFDLTVVIQSLGIVAGLCLFLFSTSHSPVQPVSSS